jgi:uncharacterized protein YbjT (DUF2867 family)
MGAFATSGKMILITSAYGNQGRMLIPKLVRAGAKVRAIRASPGGEPQLKALGAHEVIIGDASDPALLKDAMCGIEAVYHIGPSAHPRERQMGFAAIDAAMETGVNHFVFSSVLHAIVSELVQHEIKRDIEEYLVSSPIGFTILQPSDYMQVLRYQRAFETRQFVLAWNLDRRQALVDVDDVTDVAAKILLEGAPHYGATYELSSPGCFSAHDIGAIIASVTGNAVEVVETSPEARLKDHFKDKLPIEGVDHQLRVFQALRKWYSAHDFVGNPNVLTMLLGRKPTSLEDFIRREYAKMKPIS